MMSVGDYSYIIICGTTKAATTSLYFYLSDHPSVCAASLKEVRFFLDENYPLASAFRYTQGIEKYQEYFLHCRRDKVRMEATPDYLYSPGTPERIREALPHAKIIFILRDPLLRLVSWYKFARQNNDIPEQMGFDEYVELQRGPAGGAKIKQHLRALEQGRYSLYLQKYYDTFGSDRIYIAFSEELSSDPVSVLRGICGFSGLAGDFYEAYDFKVYNRTEKMRSPLVHGLYKKMRFSVRQRTHQYPFLKSALRRVKSFVELFYHRLNTGSREEVRISPSTLQFLKDYYKDESISMGKLAGRAVPWVETLAEK